MKHYVLFKLKADYSADTMQQLFDEIYRKLSNEIPGIDDVVFERNVVERECNMDVMIRVNCSTEEGLYQYLSHPLHQRFVKDTCEHVLLRVSFDCAE